MWYASASQSKRLMCSRTSCAIIARWRDLTQWTMQRGFIAEAPE